MIRHGRAGGWTSPWRTADRPSDGLPVLRVPNTTMFDYEYARLQHGLNCRLAQRVLMLDAIPAARVAAGARPPKLVTYPGLKGTWLEPDPASRRRWAWTAAVSVALAARRSGVVSPVENPLFDELVERLGRRNDVRAVVLPRTPEQAERIGLDLPALVPMPPSTPEPGRGGRPRGQRGGTMNREAVVLGTPATPPSRAGGVDERLIADRRLRLSSGLE
jgi:hypothetical protein